MIEGPIQTNNSGLVFYFDAKEPKSFIGKPTTNLLSNPTNEVIGTTSEFVQYADLAPIFNTYGTSVTYSLSLDLKSKKAGSVYVYMQNGSWTKYSFVGQSVNADTVYKRFTFNGLTAAISTPTETQAILAFYGGYGSGIIASIKNVQVEISPAATPFVNGSRSNTQGLLDLTGNSTISLANAGFDASSLIDFNGSSNYINVPHNSTIALSNAMSWEFILYPTEISTYKSVFSKSNYGNSTGYICLHTTASSLRLEASDVASSTRYLDTSFSSVLTLNTYVFCTLTYDGSNFRLYKNGILNGTVAWTYGIGSNTADFQIGVGWPGYWKGKIESFKIYNRSLSASEILKNFNSQ